MVDKDAITIALVHHPLDWLKDFDQEDGETLLNKDCHFILRGHLHRSVAQIQQNPSGECMVIAAGACYARRDFPNCYNWVRLDPKGGKGTVYLRRYSDQSGGFWTKDIMSYVEKGEAFSFTIPKSSRPTPEGNKPGIAEPQRKPPVDPLLLTTSYLRRVVLTSNDLPIGVIDPRSVERTQNKTMDLRSIYIALNTKTLIQIEERKKGKKEKKKDS